jgi:hypothetical protein
MKLLIILCLLSVVSCNKPIITNDKVYIEYETNSWIYDDIEWTVNDTNLIFSYYNNTFLTIHNNKNRSILLDDNMLVNKEDYSYTSMIYNSYTKGYDSSIVYTDEFRYNILMNNKIIGYTEYIYKNDHDFYVKDIDKNKIIRIRQTYITNEFDYNGTMVVEFLNNNNYLTEYENRYKILALMTNHIFINKNSSNILSA